VSDGPLAILDLVRHVASWICLGIGSVFCVIGGIGIVRMPDFYSRGHATGLTDTMGAGFILLGLMIQGGVSLVTGKLLMVLFFLFVTSPTATHALFKSAYAFGLKFDEGDEGQRESSDDVVSD
jgi:multicomponent Na+:H+ antiporter subunit G